MKLLITGSSGPKVASRVVVYLAHAHAVNGVDVVPASTTSIIADIALVADWAPHLDGVNAVIHFAALHAPHRETHTAAQFRRTNVEATQRLLEASRAAGINRFLLASSTSVYGKSMRSARSAVWVTEALLPEAEDIYDETKLAAEQLCCDAFSPTFTTAALRFSRSFPEPLSLMALYRLYRGVDARDVAQAFGLALTAPFKQFEAINISGQTPFIETDCERLFGRAPEVLRLRMPEFVKEYARRQWSLPARIDRVYVIDKAKALLGYRPQFGFRELLLGLGDSQPINKTDLQR